jgi:hypothetical protein
MHALKKEDHELSAYISMRQHTSACVSMRQHTSAHASVPFQAKVVNNFSFFLKKRQVALKGHEKAHALQETRQKKKKKKSQSESWNVSKKPVGFKEQLERKKPKRVMERVEEASRIHGVLRYFSHLKA